MARVLVIEDDADVRNAIRTMLSTQGHAVDVAEDGEEGVQLYAKAPYDLVVSDITMPNKDGIESLLELRSDYPDLKLIAISGVDKAYLETASAFGAVRCLPKPFTGRQLGSIVDEVLNEGRSAD